MDPLAQDQTQNKSCKQPSPKLTGDQHNLKNQNNHSVHLTLDSQANLDFQQAIRNLDVLHASEDDRRHVSNLRDRALFLAEAERQFFCQKLKTKHLVNADKGSKYFHELIRNRQRGLAIPTVCAMDGTPSTSLDQVGENFVTFFSDLFGTARDRQHSVSSLIANVKNDFTLFKGLAATRNLIVTKASSTWSAASKLQSWSMGGRLTVSMVYDFLREKDRRLAYWRNIWKFHIPPKYSFITWLALRERLLTRDRLQFLDVDGHCSLCVGATESANH
nr:putative ribonuclease H protein [Ipomoea batatas]